jgi:Terminase large subunit, T4likevirus-type, N-terminal
MSRAIITAGIDDALHFTEEQRKEIIAAYPAHEREARVRGLPSLGSGRVFPVEESKLAIDNRKFPTHWPRIGAMDFGWDHPFAACELVWDRDADVIFVSRTYRIRQATPIEHTAALRPWGKELRWAWPRDGNRETLEGAGVALAAHEFIERIQPLRRTRWPKISQRRSWPDGYVEPNAEWPIQSIPSPRRLVARISFVSPQRRQDCQRRRRPNGRDTIWRDDAQIRID